MLYFWPHFIRFIFRLNFFLTFVMLTVGEENNFSHARHKRYLPLIYQNPAAITYITGFGIPVHNLNPELVTVGMVFKAQQFLPTSYAALRQHSNHSIHKREERINEGTAVDKSRLLFYKALEELSISLGQAGRSCVLKMICEVAAIPFHYKNGIIGEIMHILLTPSSSIDVDLNKSYQQAEHNGRSGIACAENYTKCKNSILESITNLFD